MHDVANTLHAAGVSSAGDTGRQQSMLSSTDVLAKSTTGVQAVAVEDHNRYISYWLSWKRSVSCCPMLWFPITPTPESAGCNCYCLRQKVIVSQQASCLWPDIKSGTIVALLQVCSNGSLKIASVLPSCGAYRQLELITCPCRGRSGLLYSSMELTTAARQVSQAVLLQHEATLVCEAFNQQFATAQAAKRDLIATVEERLRRISQIERELGLPTSSALPTALVRRLPAPQDALQRDSTTVT